MNKVIRLPFSIVVIDQNTHFYFVGGFHQSHLIQKSLIDVYVPFLPMEKSHVRLCAENEFKKQNYVPKNKEAALQ